MSLSLPLKHDSNQNVEDNSKLFNSNNFSIVSNKQEFHKSLSHRNHKKQFKNAKHGYLIHALSDNVL